MQRYSPAIHYYRQPDGADIARPSMKEDSEAGDWYHIGNVEEAMKLSEDVNVELRERVQKLRTALTAIAAFDVGKFRGLEDEIAVWRIATEALAE